MLDKRKCAVPEGKKTQDKRLVCVCRVKKEKPGPEWA
jgi:hypothetical protein